MHIWRNMMKIFGQNKNRTRGALRQVLISRHGRQSVNRHISNVAYRNKNGWKSASWMQSTLKCIYF